MEITTFITLLFIGLFAGIASGYVGIGGGIIIIPSLIYFLGLGQHQAQGVSLALMLPPIGVLAFYKYYQSGSFNLEIEGQIIENKLLIYYHPKSFTVYIDDFNPIIFLQIFSKLCYVYIH